MKIINFMDMKKFFYVLIVLAVGLLFYGFNFKNVEPEDSLDRVEEAVVCCDVDTVAVADVLICSVNAVDSAQTSIEEVVVLGFLLIMLLFFAFLCGDVFNHVRN